MDGLIDLANSSDRSYNLLQENFTHLGQTMSRLSDLYDLQLIDREIDQYNTRLNQIADILADRAELDNALQQEKSKQDEMRSAQKNLSSAETKVKDQRLKIKKTEEKLYGGKITNPKELEDLQEESLSLKRILGVFEDRQLECMLDLDDKRDHHTAALETLQTIQENTKRLHTELEEEVRSIQAKIKILDTNRVNLTAMIDSEDINLYEKIRSQRGGVAVSKVQNKACSACGATLTASLYQEARSPNQISTCTSCGRILFA
jgi:predicted  nucleic acid-binding Zn-ribbon protein